MAQGTRTRTVVAEVSERPASAQGKQWRELRDPQGHLFARYDPESMTVFIVRRIDGEKRGMMFPLWPFH